MISKNIKKFRLSKNWSQEELASKIHVTRQTISKWERGDSVPDAELLLSLSEILECSADELLEADSISQENINHNTAINRKRNNNVWKVLGIIFLIVLFVYILIIVFGAAVDFKS